jgi:hypothetical protein
VSLVILITGIVVIKKKVLWCEKGIISFF